MTPAEFREVIRLLDSALDLFARRRARNSSDLQRELRTLTLELDLLRVRRGQPDPESQRN